jgi:tetratricopeptide (TPR) repeat protein
METTDTGRVEGGRPDDDALIHREILQIVVLIVIAVAGFFVTRAIASNNRETTVRDAEVWYERGQRLMSAGRVDEAIASLRRASVRNRYERRYALALATALARNGDTEGARASLLALREAAPQDLDVNLALARLAARRHDVTEALRFYHNTLYAPWPVESADNRREVRFELIEFLLRNNQQGRAVSELLAAAADLPDDAASHVRVAQLFAQAGDSRQALAQYERALRAAPTDKTALAGAGTSAFSLGEYLQAQNYLRRASDEVDDVARTKAIVDLVLSRDPLASRIGSAERRRRVFVSLDYLKQRLDACQAGGGNVAAEGNPTGTLEQETAGLREQLKPPAALDQDVIEGAVELFGRIEQHLATTCPRLTAEDEALALIARRHAMESK